MSLPIPFVRFSGIAAPARVLYGLSVWIWGGLTLMVKLWCAMDLCFYLIMAGLFAFHHFRRSGAGPRTPVLGKKLLSP